MTRSSVVILHYSAPPVIGGVEAVMAAHARVLLRAGHPVTIVAGCGEVNALPVGTAWVQLPVLDSQAPVIIAAAEQLEQGKVPPNFVALVDEIAAQLTPVLQPYDTVIVHNVFTKRFNLPLTAALVRLLDAGALRHCIAWCHDFDWTSPASRAKVHAGYPWDLLRTQRADMTYVVVSARRQAALAGLFGCDPAEIHVVYNGVNPQVLLGLSAEGAALIERLELLACDLLLLMPVRVTQAKNIEYALRVVAELKARGVDVKLVLTGPPDPHDEAGRVYFRSLQALRAELGVADALRFVFESGPDPDAPFTIDARIVSELFRVSDVLFMPSHREGFGMPILEAGLVGMPVVTTAVPAAEEIGGEDVILFKPEDDPVLVAARILAWAEQSAVHQLRRRVRQQYTWAAIHRRGIAPLLRAAEVV